MKEKPVILLGAGGHAKVLLDILLEQNKEILGIVEKDGTDKLTDLYGIPVIGNDYDVFKYSPDEIFLVNGIGSVGVATLRRTVYERFKTQGYQFRQVIHPSAIISSRVMLGEGVQVMAGAVVNVGCRIAEDAIINTRASMDHDCYIGAHVHIAPGCVLSGGVSVGDESLVGVGSCVRQEIQIGNQVLIGAGSTVIRNIPDGSIIYGIAAGLIKS